MILFLKNPQGFSECLLVNEDIMKMQPEEMDRKNPIIWLLPYPLLPTSALIRRLLEAPHQTPPYGTDHSKRGCPAHLRSAR
jgi:hypothetical protein